MYLMQYRLYDPITLLLHSPILRVYDKKPPEQYDHSLMTLVSLFYFNLSVTYGYEYLPLTNNGNRFMFNIKIKVRDHCISWVIIGELSYENDWKAVEVVQALGAIAAVVDMGTRGEWGNHKRHLQHWSNQEWYLWLWEVWTPHPLWEVKAGNHWLHLMQGRKGAYPLASGLKRGINPACPWSHCIHTLKTLRTWGNTICCDQRSCRDVYMAGIHEVHPLSKNHNLAQKLVMAYAIIFDQFSPTL